MFIHSPLSATALLTGSALALAACAGTAPEPRTAAAPIVEAQGIKLDPPKPKPRRPDPSCRMARAPLPEERKVALFRQFDAELADAGQVGRGQVAVAPATPALRPAASRSESCRPAAR